jgi:MHS family proline/betaine transporter-like MFS transporter
MDTRRAGSHELPVHDRRGYRDDRDCNHDLEQTHAITVCKGIIPGPMSDANAKTAYPIRRIIFASGLGTMIEWYDFYIFGSLAVIMSELMFPAGNPTWALIKTWALFATGFIVRPFGALVFGRVGDLIGRKYAFLVTLTIMGFSTFLIGLLPTYASIGVLAPAILLVLRLLQGLALGGEYGGAAVYVAEHVPDDRRGFYTSFIQITATLGLFVSLGVVLGVKKMMTPEAFTAWGWRVPFLLSIVLVGMSLYIRMRMQESPLFASLKSQGKTSLAPLKESFGHWPNLKIVLLVLFGATAGQGIVWYTGQFYALSFLQSVMKIGIEQSSIIVAIASAAAIMRFASAEATCSTFSRKNSA